MKHSNKKLTSWPAVIAALVAFSITLPAQSRPHREMAPAIRADVKMILVPVIVTDRSGRAINGLHRSNFVVTDNKTSQQITSFSNEDIPCSVGVVLDISGSMGSSVGIAKDVLSAVLASANSQDEFFTLAVSSAPVTYSSPLVSVSNFTRDTNAVANSVMPAMPGGSTALVDTIYLALSKMGPARNSRRAIVVLSDGMDNHSRYKMHDLMKVAEEADVQIYTVAIKRTSAGKKPVELTEQSLGLGFLDDLARKTGGLNFVVVDRGGAAPAAKKIALALHNQYVLGYRPADADGSNKWHKLQVKLDDSSRKVYARAGYYSR